MKSNVGKNKGEWSELHVFLTLLKNARVYAADENLNKIDDIFYIIRKIVRNEHEGIYDYIITDGGESIEIYEKDVLCATIRRNKIIADSEIIIDTLFEENKGGVIHMDSVGTILDDYHIDNISQNSRSKEDIILEIYDYHSGLTRTLPFSIKSFVGNNPTLINSSQQTNFEYKITGNLSDDEIEEINNLSIYRKDVPKADVRGRFDAILSKGCGLEYAGMHSKTYEGNLRLVDSKLPEILGELIKLRFETGETDFKTLTNILSEKNPLDFQGSQPFYRYKLSKFLMESFTGMVPGTEWNGYENTHGGYIVVKSDLEVLCLHLNNRNEFENYLFNNAYLDTYSTTRSNYATIEKTDGGLIFRLNLVVRLRK